MLPKVGCLFSTFVKLVLIALAPFAPSEDSLRLCQDPRFSIALPVLWLHGLCGLGNTTSVRGDVCC